MTKYKISIEIETPCFIKNNLEFNTHDGALEFIEEAIRKYKKDCYIICKHRGTVAFEYDGKTNKIDGFWKGDINIGE